jgi:hypothetical protein
LFTSIPDSERLGQYRVFEIINPASEHAFDYRTVNRGNLKQADESAHSTPGFRHRKGLGKKTVNRSNGGGALAKYFFHSIFFKRSGLKARPFISIYPARLGLRPT